MAPPRIRRLPRAALLGLAGLTAGCSGTSQDRTDEAGANGHAVKVSDFRIEAPKQLASGSVVLRVRNAGPDMHELILVRSNGRPLPLRPDNLTVDEDTVHARTVGVLEDDRPHSERTWKLTLAPGRYELICNMSGHYLGGMHTHLVVE